MGQLVVRRPKVLGTLALRGQRVERRPKVLESHGALAGVPTASASPECGLLRIDRGDQGHRHPR